jgi:signal transduction histidine kinase
VDRLTNLVNDLLDTTKIVEGKLRLLPSEFELNDLIRERVADLQRTSDRHTLIFESNAVVTLYADRERIEQVLNNLISNAIKYSPKGGNVIIRTESTDEGVRITVTDTGIGIPEDSLPKIFERFFRVVSPETDSLPGMGLGLYITAGIVHHHGGTIMVRSESGQGSVFQLALPYRVVGYELAGM